MMSYNIKERPIFLYFFIVKILKYDNYGLNITQMLKKSAFFFWRIISQPEKCIINTLDNLNSSQTAYWKGHKMIHTSFVEDLVIF